MRDLLMLAMGYNPHATTIEIRAPEAKMAEVMLQVYEWMDVFADTLYASRAVQLHPHGGQFDFVWLSARTPHGAYVWWARRNEEKYPPEKYYALFQDAYTTMPMVPRTRSRSCSSEPHSTDGSEFSIDAISVPLMSVPRLVPCAVQCHPNAMAVDSMSFVSPHVRPMLMHHACGEPNKIKKTTRPEKVSALVHAVVGTWST